jgi:exopolysaccharide biosynthesis polyprenyl glycosylphosphotransferase
MRLRTFKYGVALVDLVVLSFSFLVALYLKLGIDIFGSNGYLTAPRIIGILVASLLCVLIFRYNNLYKINVFLDAAAQFVIILRSIFCGIVVLVVLSFFVKTSYIVESRLVIVYFGVTSVALVGFTRIGILRGIFHQLVRRGICRSRVAILSNGLTGRAIVESLIAENTYGFQPVGVVDVGNGGSFNGIDKLRKLGGVDDIEMIVDKHAIDEIMVILDNISYQELSDVLYKCKDTPAAVKVIAAQYGVVLKNFLAERYDGVPFVNVKEKSHRSFYRVEKRFIDIVGSSVGLMLLLPWFLVIGILIKFSSPGPVLFRQARVGKNGKTFTFYKFRSMKVGNDDSVHRVYIRKLMKDEVTGSVKKITDDPRVTRIGRFIRRTSMDELPQLFNVFKGDMSLVGPRPCLPFEWEMYEPWHRGRLSAIPGCTGIWQVSGRSSVSFNEMVLMDLFYIDNASLWLDFQLILRTIPILLFSKGGY